MSLAVRNLCLTLALTISTLALAGYVWKQTGYEMLIVAMGWPHMFWSGGLAGVTQGMLRQDRLSRLRALWKQAADLGIAVQIHFEPRYAPGFEPLIKEFAMTKVIIDHLGRQKSLSRTGISTEVERS